MSDPSFNTVAQIAHVAVAYAVVLSLLLVLGPGSLYWLIPVSVGAAAIKEFWYDEKYESASVRGSSLEDFLWYCVGIIGAIGFFFAWLFSAV